MLPALIAPPILKGLVGTTLSWLAGGAAIGALAGGMSAEKARNRAQLNDLDARLQRLAAENEALSTHVEELRAASLSGRTESQAVTKARERTDKPVRDSTKTSFLKRILESNLRLRKDSD